MTKNKLATATQLVLDNKINELHEMKMDHANDKKYYAYDVKRGRKQSELDKSMEWIMRFEKHIENKETTIRELSFDLGRIAIEEN